VTETGTPTAAIGIAGSGLCIPDEALASTLGFTAAGLETGLLPPMVRRRTSRATRVAIAAAERACVAADVARQLPAIFVSAVGEMQVTDQLCTAIGRQEYPLSPTLFHNSVHNTAAGYWSMATGSMASMQAMAGLDDGFALALLEAWCQLQTVSERVLLVVYDAAMPVHFLPDYHWQTGAFALVLDRNTGDLPSLHCPFQAQSPDPTVAVTDFPARNPAMACVPLFQALQQADGGAQRLTLSNGPTPWQVTLVMP